MWSQTYDRNMTDILKIQRDLATAVAQQLKIKLTEDESAKLKVGGTKNPEAYDAYLRGARSYNEADTQVAALNTALAAANQAISLDPDYSAAHMLRASILFRISLFTNDLDARNRLREQANMDAQRAVTLAPDFGEAHLALAIIRAHALLDFRGAAGEYDRALALAPGSASVQCFFSFFAAEMGHFEPAVTAARRAVSLDPQNFASYRFLGEVLHLARRYTEAQAAYQDSKALNPDSHLLNDWMNETLLASGQTELARLRCESHTTPLDDDDRHKCLAVAYHGLHRQEDAEREFIQFRTLGKEASSFDYAGIYAQWGNAPAALRWLTKAERQRSTDLAFLRVDWKLDPIRSEPQFKAIEAKMNFPP